MFSRQQPETSCSLLRDVRLGHNVVLGSLVQLGQFASLSSSVVGEKSVIGKRSSLSNGCYLGARVRVGKCCALTHCFLADGVDVGDNVTIEADCVIGPNVRHLSALSKYSYDNVRFLHPYANARHSLNNIILAITSHRNFPENLNSFTFIVIHYRESKELHWI